ncbi:MAG: DUF1801 domain-containing protein [Bacteroidota bacterium]
MKKPANVEQYIDENEQWHEELTVLRHLMLSMDLEETIKWMFPTYMVKKKNVVAVCGFKEHFGLWFFQGATLKDDFNVLSNAQEGKTKAMRHWKMYKKEDIDEELILTYVAEAIQNQKDGNILKLGRAKKELVIPPELQMALDQNATLAQHFAELSAFNQRDFAEHIAAAKRADTKGRRLQKIIPMILRGEGLGDKYRK